MTITGWFKVVNKTGKEFKNATVCFQTPETRAPAAATTETTAQETSEQKPEEEGKKKKVKFGGLSALKNLANKLSGAPTEKSDNYRFYYPLEAKVDIPLCAPAAPSTDIKLCFSATVPVFVSDSSVFFLSP